MRNTFVSPPSLVSFAGLTRRRHSITETFILVKRSRRRRSDQKPDDPGGYQLPSSWRPHPPCSKTTEDVTRGLMSGLGGRSRRTLCARRRRGANFRNGFRVRVPPPDTRAHPLFAVKVCDLLTRPAAFWLTRAAANGHHPLSGRRLLREEDTKQERRLFLAMFLRHLIDIFGLENNEPGPSTHDGSRK